MKELEQYYNENLRSLLGVDFSELTPKQLKNISDTAAFAYWRMHIALEEWKKEVSKIYIDHFDNWKMSIDALINRLKKQE